MRRRVKSQFAARMWSGTCRAHPGSRADAWTGERPSDNHVPRGLAGQPALPAASSAPRRTAELAHNSRPVEPDPHAPGRGHGTTARETALLPSANLNVPTKWKPPGGQRLDRTIPFGRYATIPP